MGKKIKHFNILAMSALLAAGLLAPACSPAKGSLPTSTAPGLPGPAVSPAPALGLAVITASPVAPPTAPLPGPSATPDPYQAYTIASLLSRTYGGGEIVVRQALEGGDGFSRALFSYPSDGLAIYGFMDLPRGAGPFPVVIALHGYIDPLGYQTLDYTSDYADSLAQAGYLVLHPNLRGYPPSDDGDNLFRVGMAIDVLNLIALVKSQAGLPGPLEQADPRRIGLWGHSMGGGIALRVLTISPDVRAAVLYAPMSGDERQNFEAINAWSDGERGLAELAVPPGALPGISPIHFLDRIEAPISLHHGKADTLIPPAWSLDLCSRLVDLGKDVSCFLYENEPHTFYGFGVLQFKQRVAAFFDQTLKP